MRPTGRSIMARLADTARENGPKAARIRDISSQPFRGRHVVNFLRRNASVDGVPLLDAMVLWRIRQEGLRISTGSGALYGDGAYCFSVRTPPPASWHFYVDVEIPPGVGVEQIAAPGIAALYYRFLPADGDVIRVRILDTNIPVQAEAMAGSLLREG